MDTFGKGIRNNQNIIDMKKNILESYLKMRFIIQEEQLINFINKNI